MTTALIIVDVQPDFCEGGLMGVKGGNKVAEDIAWSVKNKEYFYDLIVTSQDWHEDPGEHWSETPDFKTSFPKHCEASTPGAALHPAIAKLDAQHVIKGRKSAAFSAFEGRTVEGKSLNRLLKDAGVTHVYVAGIAFDFCDKATAIDAARKGYETTVLVDYTASVYPDNDHDTIQELLAHRVKIW